MDLISLIHSRRSLPASMMDGRPISQNHLSSILESAIHAPSHRLSEPWRFVAHLHNERLVLAEAMAQAYRSMLGTSARQEKVDRIYDKAGKCGAMIAIVLSPPSPPCNPIEEELLALGAAVQNLHLAAHSLGIGGYWTTPGYTDHPHMRAVLELQSQEQCHGIFYRGYPAKAWPSPRKVNKNKIAVKGVSP